MSLLDEAKEQVGQRLKQELTNQIDNSVNFAVNKAAQFASTKMPGLQQAVDNGGEYVEYSNVCPNCSADVPEGNTFCGSCGTAIGSAPNGVSVGYSGQQQLVSEADVSQIQSIMDLENVLTRVQDAQDSDTALACSIEAQMEVISVLKSPEMVSSPFNMMIEQLNRAVSRAVDKNEREDIQMRASIMATNIVFFMEAKLRYEEDKHSAAGRELLQKGCSLLAQSAVGMVLPGGKVKAVAKMVGNNFFQNVISEGEGGFLSRLIAWGAKKEKIAKGQIEFKNFITLFVDKIDRYSDLFGQSVQLSELIQQYKPILIEQKTQDIEEPPPPVGSVIKWRWLKSLIKISILALILSFIIAVISDGTKWGAKALEGIWVVGFALWAIRYAKTFIGDTFAVGKEKKLYKKAREAYQRCMEGAGVYYDNIAQRVGISGGGIKFNSAQFAEDKNIIQAYKDYRKERWRELPD